MDVTAPTCAPLVYTALEFPGHMTEDGSSEVASFGFGECTAELAPCWGITSDMLL